MTKKRSPTAWDTAKPLLEADCMEGRATEQMSLQEVIDLRPKEYGDVPRRNFGTNWNAMKKRINKNKEAAFEDACYLEHDKLLYTFAREDPSCWNGSESQRLLPGDLDAVVVEGKLPKESKPKAIWKSRDEYQTFDLEIFRKHIHQELRSRTETPYWTYKRKMAELKKTNAEEVEDLDFYDPVLEM